MHRFRPSPLSIGSLVGLGMLALVPQVVSDTYTLHIFVLALIYLVVVAGWDLITGFAGIFSFGQVAFFVIGAYVSGIVAKEVGVTPWLAMPLAGVVTGLVGIGIGLPCLRIRGAYVAVVTYALHLFLPTLILRGGRFGTGGAGGLLGVPGLRIGDYVFSPLDLAPWYYTALAISAVSLYLIYFRIVRSSFGLSLAALRDAEDLAKSLGVDEYRTKLTVFALSASFTGLIGGFYVHYTASISQRTLGMDFFLMLLVMLTIGGMGRYPGVVLGTFIVTFASEWLRVSGSLRLIILGLIIIAAILLMPRGLVGALDSLLARLRRGRQGSGGSAGPPAQRPDAPAAAG